MIGGNYYCACAINILREKLRLLHVSSRDRGVAVAFGVKGEEMAPSPPPVQGEALHTYTREEVAQHNKKGDCWIILHGEVYDVTKWLARHPGGARIVMHYAGEDATVSGSCV